MTSEIYLPRRRLPVTEAEVWAWYSNIPLELEQSWLTAAEKQLFAAYYQEAGLLRTWRRPFFRHHFSRTFTRAVNHLFDGQEAPRILDLGCGTGTQSLFLALLGAEVVGIDLDDNSLEIFKKRKLFYEAQAGRPLKISTFNSSVFDFPYETVAPLDGIYSMFAFNLMQPSRRLFELLFAHVSDQCRLAILDGNNLSWRQKYLPGCRRPGRLSPPEFAQELRKHSFEIVEHAAGFALLPPIWFLLPGSILRPVDSWLGRYWLMAISHQILAQKTQNPTLPK